MSTSPAPALPAGLASGKIDPALAARGKRRIEWAFQSMCVLQSVRKHFIKTQPFARLQVAACLTLTPETANLLITLRDGGARIAWFSSDVFSPDAVSPDEDLIASLSKDYGLSPSLAAPPASALDAVVAASPNLMLDQGGLLIQAAQAVPEGVLGAVEQSTSAVPALRRLAREGALRFPVVSLAECQTRRLFENRYGTAQATLDAIARSSNVLLAGLHVVVLGYGSSGSALALRAAGLGAHVIVTEIDPVRALEAALDGQRVLSIGEAASLGDIFIVTAGSKNSIAREHFEKFKNAVILCNAGHASVAIDLETLTHISASHRPAGDSLEEYVLRDGRRLYLLARGEILRTEPVGRPPASVFDISCGNLALSAEYLVKSVHAFDKTKGASSLDKLVYPVPDAIDRQVAKIKLESMGIKIDRLTMEQEQYLASDGA